jgi:hypothetical protein
LYRDTQSYKLLGWPIVSNVDIEGEMHNRRYAIFNDGPEQCNGYRVAPWLALGSTSSPSGTSKLHYRGQGEVKTE